MKVVLVSLQAPAFRDTTLEMIAHEFFEDVYKQSDVDEQIANPWADVVSVQKRKHAESQSGSSQNDSNAKTSSKKSRTTILPTIAAQVKAEDRVVQYKHDGSLDMGPVILDNVVKKFGTHLTFVHENTDTRI